MTDPVKSQSLVELMAEGRDQVSKIRKKNAIPLPLKIIRTRCLDCVCGSAHEVKMCHMSHCAAWPYRFGRYPKNEDLRIPCYDPNGNLVGYRDYEGYPQEVDGIPNIDDTIAENQENESDC